MKIKKATVWSAIVILLFPTLLLLSVYFFEPYFWGLLSLYGIIVLTKLGFQFLYSSANYKLIRQKQKRIPSTYFLFVSVVISTYNEPENNLYKCIKTQV